MAGPLSVKITKNSVTTPRAPYPYFICHVSFQLYLFATSAFSFICLPLQLSVPFVCNFSFQLRLFVTSAFSFVCRLFSFRFTYLHLSFLSDINDVYSPDVFLLKTSQSTRFISIFPHYRLNFRAARQQEGRGIVTSGSLTPGGRLRVPDSISDRELERNLMRVLRPDGEDPVCDSMWHPEFWKDNYWNREKMVWHARRVVLILSFFFFTAAGLNSPLSTRTGMADLANRYADISVCLPQVSSSLRLR